MAKLAAPVVAPVAMIVPETLAVVAVGSAIAKLYLDSPSAWHVEPDKPFLVVTERGNGRFFDTCHKTEADARAQLPTGYWILYKVTEGGAEQIEKNGIAYGSGGAGDPLAQSVHRSIENWVRKKRAHVAVASERGPKRVFMYYFASDEDRSRFTTVSIVYDVCSDGALVERTDEIGGMTGGIFRFMHHRTGERIRGWVRDQQLLAPSPHVPGEAPIRFANSQYKRLHAAQLARWSEVDFSIEANVDALRREVLTALQDLAVAYARAHDVTDAQLHAYLSELEEVWKRETRVEQMAVRLWTSLKKLNGRELCSIINEGLRSEALPELQQPAVALTAMVQLHLNRGRRGIANERWPDGRRMDKFGPMPDGTMGRIGSFPTVANTFFRGTGLPTDPAKADEVLRFYEALADPTRCGRVYRVPGLLATSMDESVSRGFLADDRNAGQPKVLWTIQTCVDEQGRDNASLKPVHVAYLSHTEVNGEEELLFSAFSSFRVHRVERSDSPASPGTPHQITVVAVYDNVAAPEYVPTAPWQ